MKAFHARDIVSPVDSIGPATCPTCQSGSLPRDAHDEPAIAVNG